MKEIKMTLAAILTLLFLNQVVTALMVTPQNSVSPENAIVISDEKPFSNDDEIKQVSATPLVYMENIDIPINNAASGSIHAKNVVNLGSCRITLAWNPTIINVVDVKEEKSGLDSCFSYINNTAGTLTITAYDIQGITGNILIAEITFKPAATASIGNTCTLIIKNSELCDATPQANTIDHVRENGTATIVKQESGTNGGDNGGGNGDTPPSNRKPTAHITVSETTAFTGTAITFDGSRSSDPDGDILTYYWDFGDGTTSTQKTTTHIYTLPDKYTVTLTVDDGKGGIDTVSKTIRITTANNPPTKPTIDGTSQGHKNTNYSYTIVSTDADNDSLKYIIEWGDGNIEETGFFSSGTATSQKHAWAKAGRYVIKISASDNKTISATAEFTVFIDAKSVGILGYLIDEDGNEIYDLFCNETTQQKIAVKQHEEGRYLIDDNNDGAWDYIYSTLTEEITPYQAAVSSHEEEPLGNDTVIKLFAIIIILAVFFIYLAIRKMKKKH